MRDRTLSALASSVLWIVGGLLGLAYVLVFARFAPAMLQDWPDHVARAVIIDDLALHGGVKFGTIFQFTFMAVPYILNDLLLAGAIEVIGVKGATVLWQSFILLALPAALVLYARAIELRREERSVAFVLGLYLVTSTFYLRGFLAFELALAAIVVLLALARLLCRRWSYGLYGGYLAAFALGYLVHLSVIVLLAPALGVSTLIMIGRRRIDPIRGALLLLPLGALLAWHFGVASGHRLPGDAVSSSYYWGSPLGKALGLEWPFRRFSLRTDRVLLLTFIACLVWPYRTRSARQWLADPLVAEMGALAIVSLGVYIVLPQSLADASWVDVRAIPLFAIFLLMASLAAAGRRPLSTSAAAVRPGIAAAEPAPGFAAAVLPVIAATVAAALAVVNLIYLDQHLREFDAWLARYRSVVSAVPAGAYVLPVYTNKRDRPVKSTLHAASLVEIDRAAFIPYSFSGDQGEPMTYFRYKQRPYAPEETWYVEPAAQGVDWARVACVYDFLLVMKPFDPARIAIETRPVVENEVASLEAIAPGACVAGKR